MTEIVGGFTAFSQRSNKPQGKTRYVEDDEPIQKSAEPHSFDPEVLKKIPDKDRRWAWMEVDKHALRSNLSQMRHKIGMGRHLMAVVNADGYGHGAVEVANVALKSGADYLAVATVDEGIRLREALINAPILLLSQPPDTAIPLLLAYKLMPSIYSAEFAIQYGEAADSYGLKAPYHLCINTGLNRDGVRYSEVLQFLTQVSFHRALELKGMYTELATAAEAERMEISKAAQRFVDVVAAARQARFDTGLIHCANSASTLRYPELYFDMVRVGLAMYGMHPSRETMSSTGADLRPVMSIHARMTGVEVIPVGEGVSYGLTQRSTGSKKVCTLPLGFGDGYPRALSNRAQAIYQGQYLRQVGNICMDQCMFEIDTRTRPGVSRIDPQIGDEVVLVGSQGGCSVTLDDLAHLCGTSTYELACGFGLRLPRIYV